MELLTRWRRKHSRRTVEVKRTRTCTRAETLPNEILLHLLSFLKEDRKALLACRRVCTRWHSVCDDASLGLQRLLQQRMLARGQFSIQAVSRVERISRPHLLQNTTSHCWWNNHLFFVHGMWKDLFVWPMWLGGMKERDGIMDSAPMKLRMNVQSAQVWEQQRLLVVVCHAGYYERLCCYDLPSLLRNVKGRKRIKWWSECQGFDPAIFQVAPVIAGDRMFMVDEKNEVREVTVMESMAGHRELHEELFLRLASRTCRIQRLAVMKDPEYLLLMEVSGCVTVHCVTHR